MNKLHYDFPKNEEKKKFSKSYTCKSNIFKITVLDNVVHFKHAWYSEESLAKPSNYSKWYAYEHRCVSGKPYCMPM